MSKADSVTVSIIICTRDRATSLRSTLMSIGQAAIPRGWDVELLVVDNGSTDATQEVIGEAKLANVKLREIREPKAGKCHAQNTGLSQTSGEIILFTDDDVRVPANWIEGMCRPIASNRADAVAGGVVFPDHIETMLSQSPFSAIRGWFASTEKLDRDSPHTMVGANMAFHRRILKKVSQFDIELGPGALGFSDETLFSEQVRAAGFRLVGAFDIAVEHHFDVSRLSGQSVLDLARRMGRSGAYMHHHWEHRPFPLLVPKLVYVHLRRFWIRHTKSRGEKGSGAVSDTDVRLERNLAFYREYIVQRRRPRKYPVHGKAAGLK